MSSDIGPHLPKMIASVFGILGGWALIRPHQVLRLGVRTIPPSHASSTKKHTSLPPRPHFDTLHVLLMQCFGAQAILNAITLASAQSLGPIFYRNFAIALIPFFGFNYYYVKVVPMFTKLMWVDALGTAVMLGGCVYGAMRK